MHLAQLYDRINSKGVGCVAIKERLQLCTNEALVTKIMLQQVVGGHPLRTIPPHQRDDLVRDYSLSHSHLFPQSSIISSRTMN